MLMTATPLPALRAEFGERMQENVSLAAFTSARIGGPADVLVTVRSADELAETALKLWALEQPFIILGGGSNVLVSDRGVRGVVVLNRARTVRFNDEKPSVWVESGATLSNLAHRAAAQGLGGLEWAATVPGSIGGAVFGNAGAHGGDMAGNLIAAELLERSGDRVHWTSERMGYAYRTSALKRHEAEGVILAAELRLEHGRVETIRGKIEQFIAHRRSTQPPGASMGSMFKNPSGDYAGRLIESVGLKGARIGNAEISRMHANFFLNTGETQASDIKALIDLARDTVAEKTGILLELEIELIGEW